jgi:hypothetical protein
MIKIILNSFVLHTLLLQFLRFRVNWIICYILQCFLHCFICNNFTLFRGAHKIRNIQYRIQKLMYIKLPMYLFFYTANPLLRPWKGWASLVAISRPKKVLIFWAQKVLIFRAHPFQWPSKWICPQ